MEALALAGGKPLSAARERRAARSREEKLGLLAGFDGGSDRELSLSDLVDAVRPPPDPGHVWTSPAAPALVHKDPHGHGGGETAEQRREEAPVPSKQKQQAAAVAVAGKERRQRRRRSDNRGSCVGGQGADGNGVLLNFYVPGLLTRSMTAPRHGRGMMMVPPAGTRHSPPATATAAAGKSRIQASLDIGCWPALWGRGSDHNRNKPA